MCEKLFLYFTLIHIFVRCYLIAPLVMVVFKKNVLRQTVSYAVPLQFVVPFDYQDNFLLYLVVYLSDVVLVTLMAYLVNSSLLFLTTSINQLKSLFVILQLKFKELIHNKDNNIDIEIKETVRRHIKLTKLIKELQNAYGVIFAIHLLFVSITICFYAITAITNGGLEHLKNLVASVIIIFHIYVCCKHGQLLTESARDISTAIYSSPWEDLEDKHKKILLLTMLSSQRAPFLRSTRFTEISLATFIKIMRISWSLLSIVTSMYADI